MKTISVMLSVSIGIVVAVLIFNFFLFTLQQSQYALVFRFSKLEKVYVSPGVYIKIPFVDKVEYVDKRTRFTTNTNSSSISNGRDHIVLVKSVISWRVIDPVKFYENSKSNIQIELQRSFDGFFGEIFGNMTSSRQIFERPLDDYESQILSWMREGVDSIGVEIENVNITQIDVNKVSTDTILAGMESEINDEIRHYNELNDRYIKDLQTRIASHSDMILGGANAQAVKIRSDADIRALVDLKGLASQDQEFFNFWYSIKAYEEIFSNKDIVVLDTSSDFFRYFGNPVEGGR